MNLDGPASATDPRQRVSDERGFRRAACNPLEAHLLAGLEGFRALVLPVGSFEWHAGSPLGLDTLIASWVSSILCEKLSECMSVAVLPPLHYGASMEWAESVGVDRGTFSTFMHSLLRRLARLAKLILVVNGHGGNSSTLRHVLERLVYDEGVDARFVLVEWWRIAGVNLGHMDEWEAGVASHLGVWGGMVCDCTFSFEARPRCECRRGEARVEIVSKIVEGIGELARRLCSLP